jgi:hypothetical protein
MAEVRWLFVERCQGKMRRVTALDRDFHIVSTHVADVWPAEAPPDEMQLVRAVDISARAMRVAAAPDLDLIGD